MQKTWLITSCTDEVLLSEVTEVSNTLVRLQALDDAARALLAKKSLWKTRSRRTEVQDKDSLRTDHVSRYMSERKAFVDRFEKVSIDSLAGSRGCELSAATGRKALQSPRTIPQSNAASSRNGLGSTRRRIVNPEFTSSSLSHFSHTSTCRC